VEHGHHGQQRVVLRNRQRVGHAQRQRVQIQTALRVADAFGVARGGRSEAHAAGHVLVEHREGKSGVALRQKVLIGVHLGQRRRSRAVIEHDEVAHGAQLRRDALYGGHQVRVDEQGHVLGMVEHVGDVVVGQPDVHRMQHGPDARHGEIQLHVPVGVPAERGHFVARAYAQPPQGIGQLPHALAVVGVTVAKQRAVGTTRDDFFFREIGFDALKKRSQVQLHGHRLVLCEG